MYDAEHPGHKLCQAIIFLVASQSQWVLSVGNQLAILRLLAMSNQWPHIFLSYQLHMDTLITPQYHWLFIDTVDYSLITYWLTVVY